MRWIALSFLSLCFADAAPCVTANSSCTEWVALGKAPARSLVYRTYSLESRNEAITRALVVVHGAGRDADNYFRNALAAAFLAGALENTVVIAPRMASAAATCHDALAPNEISWNCNTWRSGGPAVSNPDLTSFDFLDEVVRKLARKDVFPNLKQIVMTGHSAGGQVLNRYEMTNQVHDKVGVPIAYVVSNPSSYAWPDATRPTDAAYSVQAHPPGYIPAIGPNAAPFRPFSGARDCTTYDLWPYGMKNRTGYWASSTSCRWAGSTVPVRRWRRGPRAWRAAKPSGNLSMRNWARIMWSKSSRNADTTRAACLLRKKLCPCCFRTSVSMPGGPRPCASHFDDGRGGLRRSRVTGNSGFASSGGTTIGPGVWPSKLNRARRRLSAS
jgi:hypothetical protein